MSSENYRSATKSHEPGWNDPPKLSYSPGAATGSGPTPKLNLNKRIAFPVTKTDTPSPNQPPPPAVGGNSTLPQFAPPSSTGNATPLTSIPANRPVPPLPPMVPAAGAPPQNDKATVDSSPDGPIDFPGDDEMRHLVKSTLEEFLQRADSSRQVEIRKRLDLMLKAWNEAKLSDGLTKKLYRLAQALTEKKAVDANEIHRSIIVEHGKECVQWAPALRQLIQVVPKQEETPAILEAKEPIMNPL